MFLPPSARVHSRCWYKIKVHEFKVAWNLLELDQDQRSCVVGATKTSAALVFDLGALYFVN